MPAATTAATTDGSGSSTTAPNLWRSLLQEAAAARPPRLPDGTVLFLGDPGVGKTRLVQRFRAAAAAGAGPEEEATEWGAEGEQDEEDGAGAGGIPRENHGRPLLSYSFFDAADPGEEEEDDDDNEEQQQAAGAASRNKGNKGGRTTTHHSGGDGDDAGTVARVHVWSLSDPAYRSLLRVALRDARRRRHLATATATGTGSSSSEADDANEEAHSAEADAAWQALGRTVCVIGIDLTRPWTFERALARWVRVLRGAVRQAARAAGEAEGKAAVEEGLARLRARQVAYLAKCYNGGGSGSSSGGGGEEEQQQRGEQSGVGVFSVKPSTTPLKAPAPASGGRRGVEEQLPEGVLEANLGVPLIVVGLKADLVKTDSFEAEQRSQHAQRFLRALCLRHGAALVYASAAADSNRRLLQRYLLHRIYPEAFPFSLRAQARREALFVPAGWDSARVIASLVSPNAPWPADAPYGEVMLPPKAERGRWDPFPADFDSGDEEDEDEDGNGDGEGVAEGGEEGVQPEGEWLEALARHVEQQLEAATAGSAEETPAAAPTRASARRKEAAAASAPGGAAAGGGGGGGGGGVRSFFEGLLSTPAAGAGKK